MTKDEEGKSMTVSLQSRGDARTDPSEAWADAIKLGKNDEEYLKSKSINPMTKHQGICPYYFII